MLIWRTIRIFSRCFQNAHLKTMFIHGAVVGLGLPLEHGGGSGQAVADQVFADDGDDHTGGADVLLDTAVDDGVLADVHKKD